MHVWCSKPRRTGTTTAGRDLLVASEQARLDVRGGGSASSPAIVEDGVELCLLRLELSEEAIALAQHRRRLDA